MSQINTKVAKITPAMAAAMLSHNRDNRPMRDANINRFADMMKKGEWQLTHQGIGFDTAGRLVDGQHRLAAVVRAGVTVEMMVTHNLQPDTFAVMDQGAKRTAADILHCGPAVAELINFAARIITVNSTPSPHVLQQVYDGIGKYAERIQSTCATKTTYFSSAAFRLAAVIRLIQGEDEDFVLGLYGKLCRSEIGALTTHADALVRLRLRNEVTATDKYEALARGLNVFDKRHADKAKVRVMENSTVAELARQILRPLCGM